MAARFNASGVIAAGGEGTSHLGRDPCLPACRYACCSRVLGIAMRRAHSFFVGPVRRRFPALVHHIWLGGSVPFTHLPS